jgi:hypothetical protein
VKQNSFGVHVRDAKALMNYQRMQAQFYVQNVVKEEFFLRILLIKQVNGSENSFF